MSIFFVINGKKPLRNETFTEQNEPHQDLLKTMLTVSNWFIINNSIFKKQIIWGGKTTYLFVFD